MRFKRILLCLLALLLFLMAGCAKPVETLPEQTEQPGSEQLTPDVSVTPDDAVELPVTPDPTPEQPPVVVPSILDDRQPMDELGVISLVPLEQTLLPSVLLLDNGLLTWGYELSEDMTSVLKFCVLSTGTGDILHETTFRDIDVLDVQLCGDRISVTDWADGEIYLLDQTLQQTQYHQVTAEYYAVHVSPDRTKAYCITKEEGIRITDLETGETSVLAENVIRMLASGRCGDLVSFSGTDRDSLMAIRGVVNLTTGEVTMLPFAGAFGSASCSEDVWLADHMGEANDYYLGKADRPYRFVPEGQYVTVRMLSDPARLLAVSYDINGSAEMTLYGLDGSFLSRCTFDGVMLMGDPVWSQADGGYYCAAIDLEDGSARLLFWDLSIPVAGESLQLMPAYETTLTAGTAVSQALYDRAAALSEQYGVTIRIADQVMTEYGDFAAAVEADERYVSSGLDAAESVLSSLPQGFMGQLLYGNQVEIEFHLTGALTKLDLPEVVSGFTSFSGFVQTMEGKTALVVDITRAGSLEQTIYHEIVHLIDNKLTFDANLREGALYSEEAWAALNPEGFTYAETTSEMPMSYFTDGYEGWFVDLYSRTFAREDRARILEYAMVSSDWTFSSAPRRLAKLEYLCACIRDSFDTTGWPEQTIWEATLARCQ